MKKQNSSSSKKVKKSPFKLSKKVVISIVVLVLFALAVFYMTKDKVAATVGDKVIYQKSVDSIFKSLPADSGLTKEQILQRIIDTKVLLHYVENSGFAITDSEFEVELQKQLTANGLTKGQFEKSISVSGATLDDARDSMTITYYVKNQIDPIIVIGADQIGKYKQENPTSKLSDLEIKAILFKDARQQLIQAIIKLHQQGMKITIN